MKNQAANAAKDGGADGNEQTAHGNYKQSANMLFGSQFLKEVYASDDKSMSRVSSERRAKENQRVSNENYFSSFKSRHTSGAQAMFSSPYDQQKRNRLVEQSSDFISPQAKQA